MLKAVIVDDEILAIDLLARYLRELEDVRIVGQFTDGTEAMETIRKENPDVIFLDIEMPAIDGLRMAEILLAEGIDADIVFITAYDRHVLKAFEVQAVDYILKPTDKNRLMKTIRTIIRRRSRPSLVPIAGKEEEKPKLRAEMMGRFVLYGASGEPVKWRTRKVKELCAYLLNQGRPMHRQRLIEDLWPDLDAQKSIAILYTTVYQLRKVFLEQGYSDAISFADDRYELTAGIDTDRDDIRNIVRVHPPEERMIQELLKLTSKEYLDEEDYVWSLGEAEKLRSQTKTALETYLDSIPDPSKVTDTWTLCLEKLFMMDPLCLPYYNRITKHYESVGNGSALERIYRLYHDTLNSEMGNETFRTNEKR